MYADIIWSQVLDMYMSSEEYRNELQSILDIYPYHIPTAQAYVSAQLSTLEDIEDPALLEQTVTDILGTTQTVVKAYPRWYAIQFFEAQTILEISQYVLLPNFWLQDRVEALKLIAPNAAQTQVMEARAILTRVRFEDQNEELYQSLNKDALIGEDPQIAFQEVENLLDQAVVSNPALPDLWIARVAYLEQRERTEEIAPLLEDYVQYVTNNQLPANPEIILLLVQQYIDQEQFSQAESYLLQVQRAYPDLPAIEALQQSLSEQRQESSIE